MGWRGRPEGSEAKHLAAAPGTAPQGSQPAAATGPEPLSAPKRPPAGTTPNQPTTAPFAIGPRRGELALVPFAQFCDTEQMPYTAAERQRRRRARLKAGEEVPSCTCCGARLQLERRERPDRQGDGLCWSCWIQTADGKAYERERRKRAREADPEKIRAQTLASVRRVRAKAKGGTTTDGGQA